MWGREQNLSESMRGTNNTKRTIDPWAWCSRLEKETRGPEIYKYTVGLQRIEGCLAPGGIHQNVWVWPSCGHRVGRSGSGPVLQAVRGSFVAVKRLEGESWSAMFRCLQGYVAEEVGHWLAIVGSPNCFRQDHGNVDDLEEEYTPEIKVTPTMFLLSWGIPW